MPQLQDPDGLAFINEIEKRRGGELGWRTFSTWYADSDGNIREYGVFLYQVNGSFYYEDYEHENTILGFKIQPRKGKQEYVMLEGTFQPQQVQSLTIVTKRRAKTFAEGYLKEEKLKKANILQRIFSKTVTMVRTDDGKTRFFEYLDKHFSEIIAKGV